MARKRKTRSKTVAKKSPSAWPDRLAGCGQVLGRTVCRLVALLAVIAGGAATMHWLEQNALRHRAANVPYEIELSDLPAWMPMTLRRFVRCQITPQGVAFEAPDLCRIIHDRAEGCPWIAAVRQVRRIGRDAGHNVVRVCVRFRRPMAKIRRGGQIYFVDAEGVVLTAHQAPQWMTLDADGPRYYVYRDAVPRNLRGLQIHYPVIEGLDAPPPPLAQRWPGEDLAAGLRLVQLIRTRKYANQVTVIDVRNYNQRITACEPQLRMYAQQGQGRPTDIRFGRFPHPGGGDWVISPERKMRYLDNYVTDQGGRLAGVHSYIDVRFDELRVSLN